MKLLKYVDTLVSFQEVPNKISLCINISNCPCHCEGCHSPYLSEDTGTELSIEELSRLIMKNKGIDCVCLMGGDSNPEHINTLAKMVKTLYSISVAWYSGRQYIPDEIELKNFDYVKIGPYIQKLGGLDNPNTNQIMYKVEDEQLINITHLFRREFRNS